MSKVGGPQPGAILGEAAKPPFAVVPDSSSLFLNRARRLATLAPGHELDSYLSFLAMLTGAQHEIQADLPPPALPSLERMGQAMRHGMPPISRGSYEPDEAAHEILNRLLGRLAGAELPQQTANVIEVLSAASSDERRNEISAALKDAEPAEDTVVRSLVLASLQVLFTRMSSVVRASDLKPVADGACPVCGSGPISSAIVGWPKAYNTRFCTCSLCATMWNVMRVSCLLCGSSDGVSFRSIEGKPDTVKAETCEKCRGYVKVLYQVKDPTLEPLADDVATLGLDMLMSQQGWKRGGRNPFLLGY
jgi:FdhE protein